MRKTLALGSVGLCLSLAMVLVSANAGDPVTVSEVKTSTAEDVERIVIESLESEGAAAAVVLYGELLEQNPDLAYGCHSAAHKIGQLAALQEGPDRTVRLAPDLCQGGFLHGVLQVAATTNDGYSGICEKLAAADRSACAHGFGHLLTVKFPDSIDAALSVCAQFFDGSEESGKLVSRCGGGAAMEYGASIAFYAGAPAVSSDESHMGPVGLPRVSLPPGQMNRPCRVLQEFSSTFSEAHHECVSHLAFFFMADPDVAVPVMHDRCRTAAPRATEFGLCMQSVGLRAVERFTLRSPSHKEPLAAFGAVRDLCSPLPEEASAPCAVGGYTSVMTLGPGSLELPCSPRWIPEACTEAQEIVAAASRQ